MFIKYHGQLAKQNHGYTIADSLDTVDSEPTHHFTKPLVGMSAGNIYEMDVTITPGGITYKRQTLRWAASARDAVQLRANHDARKLAQQQLNKASEPWTACLKPVNAAYNRADTRAERAQILAQAIEAITRVVW